MNTQPATPSVELEEEEAPELPPAQDNGEALYSSDEISPYVNALIYSDPGLGKTTLAASAADHPEMGEVLFLNFEGGLLSIKGKRGVKIRDVRSVDDVEDSFWAVVQKRKGYERIRTVVIDSGTELQGINLEQIAAKAFKKKRGKRETADQLFQEDYGKDTQRLKRVFRWFRDGDFNFIVTAHAKRLFEKKGENSEPKLVGVQPAFTNKLGTSLCGFVDFVWYMYKDDESDTRWLLTREHEEFYAKTRGIKFSTALGPRVQLAIPGKSEGHTIATLYDLMLKSEGITISKKKA
jgi:phage nucleotide-binding protein